MRLTLAYHPPLTPWSQGSDLTDPFESKYINTSLGIYEMSVFAKKLFALICMNVFFHTKYYQMVKSKSLMLNL